MRERLNNQQGDGHHARTRAEIMPPSSVCQFHSPTSRVSGTASLRAVEVPSERRATKSGNDWARASFNGRAHVASRFGMIFSGENGLRGAFAYVLIVGTIRTRGLIR
jgi:hypothetical protein